MSSALNRDFTLLSQLRDGKESAFQSVYQLHHQKIYQFSRSFLKDAALAEDVFQETFLNLWVNKARINPELAIEPLLFTICRRLIIDAFRKATASDRQRQTLIQQMAETDNATEDKILYRDLMQFTESAIANLPQQQQTVFRLSRFEGLSYDEISEMMSISRNTVKNHLIVASKKLKMALVAQGVLSILLALLLA